MWDVSYTSADEVNFSRDEEKVRVIMHDSIISNYTIVRDLTAMIAGFTAADRVWVSVPELMSIHPSYYLRYILNDVYKYIYIYIYASTQP